MSLDTAGRRILCDSLDCPQTVSLPLVKPDASGTGTAGTKSAAAGWVFVRGVDEDQHYCPSCAERVLQRLAA